MRLSARIAPIVAALPPGASVTLTRDMLAEWLAHDAVEDAPAAQERDELTVKEWAALEHRSPGTICAWLVAGLVPGAYKLHAREWRIPRAGIVAFKTAQAKEHPALQRAPEPTLTPRPVAEPFDALAYRRTRRAREAGLRLAGD